MGSREPLAGWVELWHRGLHLKQGGVTLEVSRDGYWKARANANGPRDVIQRAAPPSPLAAQLAAEDAARALVAEMAAALGGRVTWADAECSSLCHPAESRCMVDGSNRCHAGGATMPLERGADAQEGGGE